MIFNDTIANNILLYKDHQSNDRIIKALKDAQIDLLIEESPNGLDTILGESGMNISGGQRQRIAIARALIRKPEILVLDEATSSLDNISEKIVQESLKKASKHQTTIVIAHRLSTIEHADKIVVLDNGRVVEEGKHNELFKKGGFYFDLYQQQKEKEIEPSKH